MVDFFLGLLLLKKGFINIKNAASWMMSRFCWNPSVGLRCLEKVLLIFRCVWWMWFWDVASIRVNESIHRGKIIMMPLEW